MRPVLCTLAILTAVFKKVLTGGAKESEFIASLLWPEPIR
jgi:hypothetical protein